MTPEAFSATPLGDVDFPTAYMRITCMPRTAALID
jgi:hypothetical protein